MTRITAVDVDTGESAVCEIPPNQYVVICGGDRYISHEQISANGTAVITIKTHKGDYR